MIQSIGARGFLGFAAVLGVVAYGVWLSGAAVPTEADQIMFENMAGRAGIAFALRDSATPEKHQIETMVGGVAVFDYNNDGRPDIYFVNGARQPSLEKSDPSYYNRLYRNNGDGTFTDVTLERFVNVGILVQSGGFVNANFRQLFATCSQCDTAASADAERCQRPWRE